jgi:hypothetical protein
VYWNNRSPSNGLKRVLYSSARPSVLWNIAEAWMCLAYLPVVLPSVGRDLVGGHCPIQSHLPVVCKIHVTKSNFMELSSYWETRQEVASMNPEGSLPCSQEPSTGPYLEPVRCNLYHRILSKIHFNIIHSQTSWYSYWSLFFWISHQYPICIPLLPHSCYMPCPSHHPWLDHSVWRRVQVMKLLIMQFSVRFIYSD